MDKSIHLQQSVIKEVAALFGNDEAMRKVLSLAKKLRKESHGGNSCNVEELTEEERKEVLGDIRDGLAELRLEKEGKVRLDTWEDFRNELRG